jgi:regulator of replication initiation timing
MDYLYRAMVEDGIVEPTPQSRLEIDALKAEVAELLQARELRVGANLRLADENAALKAELADTVTDMGWHIDKLKSEAEERAICLHERCVEVANLKAENDRARKAYLEYEQENFLLKAENEQLRKDAERYRFLRMENALCAGEGFGFAITQEMRDNSEPEEDDHVDYWIGTDLDSVVDAAMSALPENEGE